MGTDYEIKVGGNIEYDRYAKALYIRLQDKERGRTLEINKNLNLDVDEKGNLVAIEILNPEDYPIENILKPSVKDIQKILKLLL